MAIGSPLPPGHHATHPQLPLFPVPVPTRSTPLRNRNWEPTSNSATEGTSKSVSTLRIAQNTRAYKVKRHNLSGRQRFAHVMATNMVRDSIRLFDAPRYERAEAFAKAASGIQVKGLRQMM